MDTAIIGHHPSATATVLTGMLPFPLPQSTPEVSLEIIVPDFHLRLDFPVEYIRLVTDTDSEKVTVVTTVDEDVNLVLTLAGTPIERDTKFLPVEVSLEIQAVGERAQTRFVISTLWALLGLTKQVHIQLMEAELDLNFALPLPVISQMLRLRQVAYRLMVIEQAIGRHFSLPELFSGDDLSVISRIYHAIVNRCYVWPDLTITIRITADQDGLAWLAEHEHLSQHVIGPESEDETLFGQLIPLGRTRAVIEDGVIQNLNEVRRAVERGDGSLIEVVIRSLRGQVRYEFPEAPRLPAKPWEERIQGLINLESQLDASIVERYHALAAATLADLTEEEKKEITARSELDNDDFPAWD